MTGFGLVAVSVLVAAPNGRPLSPDLLHPDKVRPDPAWSWVTSSEGQEICGPECPPEPLPAIAGGQALRVELAALELPAAATAPADPPLGEPLAGEKGETSSAAQHPPVKAAGTKARGKLRRQQVEVLVRELAPEYGLDPTLVLEVIAIESRFDPAATSPKSARGLMQLMPATASRFGVEDLSDPVQNLRGGMAYLRWLLIRFDGDLRLALAGYNAGEGAVSRFDGIPPYPETQRYVERITRAYGKTQHPVPTA